MNIQSPYIKLRRRVVCKINVSSKSESCTNGSKSSSSTSANIETPSGLNIISNSSASTIDNNSNASADTAIELNQDLTYDCEESDDSENDLDDNVNKNDIDKKEKLCIIPTQRGKDKLCYKGFFYTVDKMNGLEPLNKIYWKCERTGNNTVSKCSGRAWTINYYEPVNLTIEHNHMPEPEKEICLISINKIKYKAKETGDNPRSIIKSCQIDVDDEAARKMVRHNNLTQMINRMRNMKVDHGPNPQCLDDLVIPDDLKLTYQKTRFLLSDKDDILVFASDINIEVLNNVNHWYCDGTFDVSPLLYKQLYTINVIFKGKNLPLVYALLPDKKEVTYNKLFYLIKNNISKNPSTITTDFEKAALNAISKNFPSTTTHGCYFHLVQNMWKHVNKNGLSDIYVSSKDFRKLFKLLKSLAFIPAKDVIYGFKKLKELKNEASDQFKVILSYFEEFYIGLPMNETTRKLPLYPIELWNVNKRLHDDLPRTNNNIESWHKAFELDCKKHPTINKIIEQFRLEQQNTTILYHQLVSGDLYSRKKDEKQKDDCIKGILENYKKQEIMTILDQLSFVL